MAVFAAAMISMRGIEPRFSRCRSASATTNRIILAKGSNNRVSSRWRNGWKPATHRCWPQSYATGQASFMRSGCAGTLAE